MAVAEMMNGRKTGEIEIFDTLLAAFLQTQGHRPVRITPGQGPRKAFVFSGVPASLIQDYALDRAKVSPLQFGLSYRALLRRLHQA